VAGQPFGHCKLLQELSKTAEVMGFEIIAEVWESLPVKV
jgi:hypothetical protein